MLAQLDAAGEDMGVATRYDIPSLRFQDLLKALHVRTGRRVVVLVDEYDKPILDTLERREVARANRDFLRGLYGTIKSSEGAETVYNPFDILLLFDRREFGAYWFETGTPAFLLDTLVSRGVEAFALDDLFGSDELLSSFDMDDVAPEALLFQTGYLTIREVESVNGTRYYRLGYPNREVRQSLNRSLLRRLVRGAARGAEPDPRLLALLRGNDFAGLERLFRAFFAGIPHQWHTNNDIARYEGYYASVFYACFAALGLGVRVEDSTNRGRLDLAVHARRPSVSVRVQGGGAGLRGCGAGAVARSTLRGQVPRPERADPLDRGGVQSGDPESHRLRRGGRLIRVQAASSRRAIPAASPISVPAGLHHGVPDGVACP